MQAEEIVNKVAKSSIITLDLEKFYPEGKREIIDLATILFQDQILREKDLREFVINHNWQQYENKFVAITCSKDVIIPTWAFMLLAIHASPFAKRVVFGTLDDLERELFLKIISELDWSQFQNAKVVVKGCSKINIPQSIYIEVVNKLRPIANSIMFGEPCSTVPLYKRAKTQ